MPKFNDAGSDAIRQAVALAEEVAPEIDSVVFTLYPDRETLDTFRPGEDDPAAVAALTRAVAARMHLLGVEVMAQTADRAAFRRWMQGRADTADVRRSWLDRGKLLRGAEALQALGLSDAKAPAPPRLGTAPGPVADKLLALLDEEEDAEDFDALVQALLAAGRQDVLDLALRKLGVQHGEDAADDLAGELLAAAESGALGPAGWAGLVTLPVALPAESLPDAAELGASLLLSGCLEDSVEVRFLPGWRSPEMLEDLSPVVLRRVLLDMLAGKEPRDLPPGETDDLTRSGFGLLVGVEIDWRLPLWEDILAAGDLPAALRDEAEDSPEGLRRAALFDSWRGAMFERHEGCVPLALIPPSEVGDEIAGFLEEAGEDSGGIEEIREFVTVARLEAGNEEVVCRPEVIGDRLELSIYTESGRFLDSLSLPPDRLPARAEEMPRLLESFVRMVKDAPGR